MRKSIKFGEYVIEVDNNKAYIKTYMLKQTIYSGDLIIDVVKLSESEEESYFVLLTKHNIMFFEFYYPENGKGGIRVDRKIWDIKLGKHWLILKDKNYYALVDKDNKFIYAFYKDKNLFNIPFEGKPIFLFNDILVCENKGELALFYKNVVYHIPKQGNVLSAKKKGFWLVVLTEKEEILIESEKHNIHYFKGRTNKYFKDIIEG